MRIPLVLLEPHRLRIVELLRAGPAPVNTIARRLRYKQPQVSKHLRILRKAGIVTVRPDAQQRYYALRPEPFREMHAWIESYRHLWDERFKAMDELIEELTEESQGGSHERSQGT